MGASIKDEAVCVRKSEQFLHYIACTEWIRETAGRKPIQVPILPVFSETR
jgi:hypothetical protein